MEQTRLYKTSLSLDSQFSFYLGTTTDSEYSQIMVTVQVSQETVPNSLLASILYWPISSASDSITINLASPVDDEYVTFLFLLDLSFTSLLNHVTVIGFVPVTLITNSNFWPRLIVYDNP